MTSQYWLGEIKRLETERNNIIEAKFMGGGFGLILFLFFSMGLGIIAMVVSAAAKQRRLGQIDIELTNARANYSIAIKQEAQEQPTKNTQAAIQMKKA